MPHPKNRGAALVTGGTSGIGAACARLLRADGWRVFLAARSPREGMPEAEGFLRMDVADEASVAAAAAAWPEGEALRLIVHAAGMGICGGAEDTPDEAVRAQMETNYFGVLRVGRHFLPILRAQRGGQRGKVIVIGSVAGLIAIPFQSHYSSSKYALEAYVEALRLEARPLGIEAMLVEPGDTRTGFTAARRPAIPDGSPYAEACRRAVLLVALHDRHGARRRPLRPQAPPARPPRRRPGLPSPGRRPPPAARPAVRMDFIVDVSDAAEGTPSKRINSPLTFH